MQFQRANKRYYVCFNNSKHTLTDLGEKKNYYFFIRPRDSENWEDIKIQCPECGAVLGDPMRDETGRPLVLPGRSEPKQIIEEMQTPQAVQNWRRAWVVQTRELPFAPAANQKVFFSFIFITQVLPKLTDRQFRILVVLLSLADSRTRWAKVSTSTLATYCMPGNANKPLKRESISKAIRAMSKIEVEIYDSVGNSQVMPLVSEIVTRPKQYRVNMP